MKKIVLVGLNTRHTHSSLSLVSLQAYWEIDKARPQITRIDHDLNQGNDVLLFRLIRENPGLVGFSTYIWNIQQVLAISGALKAALPECKIILGGPEVSFSAEYIFNIAPWIDGIVIGEGEETWKEICEKFLETKDFSNIAGLYIKIDNEIVIPSQRPLIANLDTLPSPFRMGLYGNGSGFTYYEASRGCPFKCAYCLSSVLGPLRTFSLERVFLDLDWFMKSNFTQIRFADRTFNYDLNRATAILEFILKNNQKQIKFHFELKPDLLNDKIIDLLSEASHDLFHLEIGIQSTDPATLAEVRRSQNHEVAMENIKKLRKRTKCHVHIDLLAGMPGEDFNKFKKTLNDAFEMTPSSIQVGLVKVLKGTPLESRVKSGEIFPTPYPPYAVVRSKWLSPEEIILCQEIGKLVEGIFNPQRFANSLNFFIKTLFNNSPALFFETLAKFWKDSGRLFFSFSPDSTYNGLLEFVEKSPWNDSQKIPLRSLLLHEFRLTQKVPSGKQGPNLFAGLEKKKPLKKLAPGYKVFWYNCDLLEILSNKNFTNIPINPAPMVYYFEKDLSQSPKTGFMEVSLLDRVYLAGVSCIESFDDFVNLVKIAKIPQDDFTLLKSTMEKWDNTNIVIPGR